MKPLNGTLICCLSWHLLAAGTSLSGIPSALRRVEQAAARAGVSFPLADSELRIFKAAHRLELWASGKQIRTYKVGLGHRGLADKRVSGDHLTPEGRYYVCTRNAQSAFHLFLGISYPGGKDAERGVRAGLISRAERDAILAAQQRKACPPWQTGLGGTMGIHGHGSSADWSWGCVALEDAEVDELWVSCPLGTPVFIAP